MSDCFGMRFGELYTAAGSLHTVALLTRIVYPLRSFQLNCRDLCAADDKSKNAITFNAIRLEQSLRLIRENKLEAFGHTCVKHFWGMNICADAVPSIAALRNTRCERPSISQQRNQHA